MRILLAHSYTDNYGGGELLALRAYQALEEAGYDVTFYTAQEPDRGRLYELFEVDVGKLNVEVSHAGRLLEATGRATGGRFVRLRRYVQSVHLKKELKSLRNQYDLILETQAGIPLKGVDLSYIHFPSVLPTSKRMSPPRRLYDWLMRNLVWGIRGTPRLVLTNSRWTAGVIARTYGVRAQVLHPPVDVEYFSNRNLERRPIVATVTRLTVEKGLEDIVDVAYRLPDYRFVIAGSYVTDTPRVRSLIYGRMGRRGVKNVDVQPNLLRSGLRLLLYYADFYLHPPFAEHFGISVAEAVSAGCIPVVYRDGGAWTDIVRPIWSGLGYRSLAEVPGIIREVEADPELRLELRLRCWKHSQNFTYKSFRDGLLKHIKTLLVKG
ncbi:MAG: glycosyltransferase family 4 protein [Candidatus Bathyarchaeia archaeon]